MTDHTSLPGTASELAALRCRNGAPKLPSSAIVAASTVLPGWSISETRIDKTFLFKRWLLKLYLDITNIYNNQNVEVNQPNFDFTRRTALTGLPIIPSFGIRAEF